MKLSRLNAALVPSALRNAILCTLLGVPCALASNTCLPLADAEIARLTPRARALMHVPDDVPFNLVESDLVTGTCSRRLIFESIDTNRLRETAVYLSDDHTFLSRDIVPVEQRANDMSEAPPIPAWAPSRGPKDAAITVVEFSDFECPYCRTAAKVLSELQESNRNLRVVYRHLPLMMHPWALTAARIASCVPEDAFWKLHDFYFANQQQLTPENVIQQSRSFLVREHIEAPSLEACVASESSLANIRKDARAAANLAINGTPTLFANGRALKPTNSVDDLSSQIQNATGIRLGERPRQARVFLALIRSPRGDVPEDLAARRRVFIENLRHEKQVISAGFLDSRDIAVVIGAAESAAAQRLLASDPGVVAHLAVVEIFEWNVSEQKADSTSAAAGLPLEFTSIKHIKH